MTLQGGMGDNFWIDGLDLSGDIGALGRIASPLTVQDTTPINKYAVRRLGLLHDGGMDFTAYWNPGAAADTAHSALKTLPTADRVAQYCRGTTLGAPAAGMVAKQIGYDGNRPADGSFTLGVSTVANAYGLEWGTQLTAGKVTATGESSGTGVDLGAESAFGMQAYLQVFAFTGTSAAILIQGSDDDDGDPDAWAEPAGGFSFTVTTAPYAARLATGSATTIERYCRQALVSVGGFTSITYGVMVIRNEVEQ